MTNKITFKENEMINFESKKVGCIVSAKYGANSTFIDVDVFVASFLKPDGSLKFKLTNETMRKDPLPYVVKSLILEYTDYIERDEQPPSEVRVEYAGNSDVNGIYVPNGIQWHCRDKSYCSNYVKKNNPDFQIYHEGPGLYWYIHNDNEKSKYGRIPLYKCKSDSRVPPSTGWSQYGVGGMASEMPVIKILDSIVKDDVYSDGMYSAYIAIDEYEDTSITNLESCVNDGKLLEKCLQDLGYNTIAGLSNKKATKQNIEKMFDEIFSFLKTKKNSSFVLYIAGHGCKHNGFDKFLCSDYSEDKIISSTIDYDFLNNYTKKFNTKHQLLLVDACFSGSLVKEELRESSWNDEYIHSRSMDVISSVQNSGKAIENKQNGIFTKSFINILNELLNESNYIKFSDICKNLEKNVDKELSLINIELNPNYIPKFGRQFKKIQSRDDNHKLVDLNGEIIFFKNDNVDANFRGVSYSNYYTNW